MPKRGLHIVAGEIGHLLCRAAQLVAKQLAVADMLTRYQLYFKKRRLLSLTLLSPLPSMCCKTTA